MKDKIKTALLKITFLPWSVPHGYANGYVGVPEGHPWFKVDYSVLDSSVHIHGGLTYGKDRLPVNEEGKEPEIDGLWWVGFDTCHLNDSQMTCPEYYCKAQVESLKAQAVAAYEAQRHC
jgi:hypothetical protein